METIKIIDLIEHLKEMRPSDELPDFDMSKKNDYLYCVEWGINKGHWMERGVYDRYIGELEELLTKD